MGAWGSGILEDDTALDFLDELREANGPFERMRRALEDAAGAEFLDYDAGQAALVSAAVVDTALGGGSLADDAEEVRAWLAALGAADARPLRPLAARALGRVLAPGSELHELWSENEEEFPRWKGAIEAIAARLTAG